MSPEVILRRRASPWVNYCSTISIVVTTFSVVRFRYLRTLFDSILRQNGPERLELVVVVEKDRGLAESVKRYLESSSIHNCIVLYYPHLRGMSDARNKGAAESTSPVVAFVDDDVVLGPNWLESVLRGLDNPRVVAVTGPSSPLWTRAPHLVIPPEFSWLIGSTDYFIPPNNLRVRNVWGNNMAIRKDEFTNIGGFSNDYGLHNAGRKRWFDPPSEDVDLSLRLMLRSRRELVYVPGMRVGHWVECKKVTWPYIAQRSYSIGYQRRAILVRYPSSAQGDPIRSEKHLAKRIMLLLPKSFVLFPTSPRLALNLFTLIVVVSLFSAFGFFDRRMY